MPKSYKPLMLVLLLLLSTGCSARSKASLYSREGAPIVEASLLGGANQLANLENQPTLVNIPLSEDNEAWVRARYFFQIHSSGIPVVSEKLLASDMNSLDPYKCKVERSAKDTGVDYNVNCSSVDGSNNTQSNQIAKNLARFIETGVLNLGLVG